MNPRTKLSPRLIWLAGALLVSLSIWIGIYIVFGWLGVLGAIILCFASWPIVRYNLDHTK